MRVPRNLSSGDLIKVLKTLGYQVTRQAGSHIRLTTNQHGQHHITVPRQKSLRIGTLAAILGDVAIHFKLSREELYKRIF